jgi:hypothetical protein
MNSSSAAHRHLLAGALGLVLLAATSALPYLHFTAHGGGGDVTLYESYAQKLLDGRIPYHEFFFEYPPLSLVALVSPKATGLDYGVSLRLEMWVLLAVTLVAVLHTLRTIGADTMRVIGAAVLIGCSPALLGPIVFERFDAWPAALLSIALAFLAAERWTSGSVGLALGICTKLYPVVVAPFALARVFAAAGRRVTTRASIAGVIAGGIVTLPFAVVGLGGVGFSYYAQFKRPLQLESTGAAVLLALDRLGLYDTTVQSGLSKDIAGGAASVVALASTAVQLTAILLAVWWFWRGPRSTASMLTASAAAVVAFVAFGKVLSPQYVIWIVPLVPLVARRVWVPAVALTVAAAGLTGLYFPLHYSGIRLVTDWIWVLLARDLALVALAVVLLGALRREAASAAEARR